MSLIFHKLVLIELDHRDDENSKATFTNDLNGTILVIKSENWVQLGRPSEVQVEVDEPKPVTF